MQLRYPRWIHAEGRTHRIISMGEEDTIFEIKTPSLMEDPNLSRNASSSRAIPTERFIQDVLEDTAYPVWWGKNQPGMQAREENNEFVEMVAQYDMNDQLDYQLLKLTREDGFEAARDYAIMVARAYAKAGYHKQIVNRFLEPYSHINVLVSATTWDNFFELRDHPDAQPEIQELARAMKAALEGSTPVYLMNGSWHLPYVDLGSEEGGRIEWWARNIKDDRHSGYSPQLPPEKWMHRTVLLGQQISVARCARVSYLTHDGKEPDIQSDLALYDRLVGSKPLHASPAEHVATPMPGRWGNFTGWKQHRQFLEEIDQS
jgi:hypothetical protein